MNDHERDDFEDRIELIRSTAALFPHSKLTEESIVMLLSILSPIPTAELAVALQQAAIETNFMPTPKQIMDAWKTVTSASSALSMPTPDEAWAEVTKQIARVGYVGIPKFSHPLIKDIVDGMGGWIQLCASENGMADRAHFLKMFAARVERQEKLDRLTPASRQLAQQNGLTLALPDLSMNRKLIENGKSQ